MKRIVSLWDLEPGEVRDLVALAKRLARRPEPRALEGRLLGLLFFNPSLRTLASSQAAMARLGGSSLVLQPGHGTWALETRPGVVMDGAAAEHVREAIPVLAGMVDALGVRAFASGTDLAADLGDEAFAALDALCPKPLVNLESAIAHPTQAIGDWKTLDDLSVPAAGRLVLAWANHPKALPLAVPATVVHMAALRGMEVVVAAPEPYLLPPPVIARAERAAAVSGGSVRQTTERAEAMEGAHVLYAKSWSSPPFYGDAAAEEALRGALGSWCVEESWFSAARPDCRFMHCLPVRRNVVARDEVLDGPRSAVIAQAHNRLASMMACLHRLLSGGSPAGTAAVGGRPASARV